MAAYRTIVTAQIEHSYLEQLKEYSEVIVAGWAKTGNLMTEDELIKILEDADILIVGYEKVSAEVISSSKKLRLIGCCRSNPVNVDIDAARSAGIPVLYTPGRNANSAAEFTMGLILAEIRHIARAYHSLKIGRYLGKPAEGEKLPAKKDVIWGLDG